jgi:phosphatidylinositol glycan class K
VYIIDRYTYYALEFLERVEPDSQRTMGEFMEVCPKRVCISTVGRRTDLFPRDPYRVPITDFFGSVRRVEIGTPPVNLTHGEAEQPRIKSAAASKRHAESKFQYRDPFPIDTLLRQS